MPAADEHAAAWWHVPQLAYCAMICLLHPGRFNRTDARFNQVRTAPFAWLFDGADVHAATSAHDQLLPTTLPGATPFHSALAQ